MLYLLVVPGRIFSVKSCLTGTASVQCCFHSSVSVVFCVLIVFNCYIRALLHFLDPYKFNNKDEFVQNYKNLSSFNEIEVLLDSFLFLKSCIFRLKKKEDLPTPFVLYTLRSVLCSVYV